MLAGAELDDALVVVAGFIDLKSPYMSGHGRRCSELAADAARVLGLDDASVATLRRDALVHDFGTTGVPNSIGALGRAAHRGPVNRRARDRLRGRNGELALSRSR
jgi:hypothetical protein